MSFDPLFLSSLGWEAGRLGDKRKLGLSYGCYFFRMSKQSSPKLLDISAGRPIEEIDLSFLDQPFYLQPLPTMDSIDTALALLEQHTGRVMNKRAVRLQTEEANRLPSMIRKAERTLARHKNRLLELESLEPFLGAASSLHEQRRFVEGSIRFDLLPTHQPSATNPKTPTQSKRQRPKATLTFADRKKQKKALTTKRGRDRFVTTSHPHSCFA
jgi:hypothetical protein